MDRMKLALKMLRQIMDLGMTVMARCDAVIGSSCLNLVEFDFSVNSSFLFSSRLQKASASSAAVIVGTIGGHIDKIFLPNHFSDYIPHIIGSGVAKALSDQLTGVLQGELQF